MKDPGSSRHVRLFSSHLEAGSSRGVPGPVASVLGDSELIFLPVAIPSPPCPPLLAHAHTDTRTHTHRRPPPPPRLEATLPSPRMGPWAS